jgi:Zn-dependent protease
VVRFRIPIGRVFGIRLSLHASWFLVFGLVTWVTTTEFADVYPRIGSAGHVVMGLVTGSAFFACLTAHEISHALVARRFGIDVRGITLFMFGGVAEISGEVPSPAREFAVALVGPATSVALGGISALAAIGANALGWSAFEGVFTTLALVNLGVAVFNLVPGLPLDGGRLLRAGLWRLTGSYTRATRVAAGGGRLVAAALGIFGLVLVAAGDPFGLWYVPMGIFLWLLARGAGRARLPAPSRVGAPTLDGEGRAAETYGGVGR